MWPTIENNGWVKLNRTNFLPFGNMNDWPKWYDNDNEIHGRQTALM